MDPDPHYSMNGVPFWECSQCRKKHRDHVEAKRHAIQCKDDYYVPPARVEPEPVDLNALADDLQDLLAELS